MPARARASDLGITAAGAGDILLDLRAARLAWLALGFAWLTLGFAGFALWFARLTLGLAGLALGFAAVASLPAAGTALVFAVAADLLAMEGVVVHLADQIACIGRDSQNHGQGE